MLKCAARCATQTRYVHNQNVMEDVCIADKTYYMIGPQTVDRPTTFAIAS